MNPDGTKSKADYDGWGHAKQVQGKDATGAVIAESSASVEAGGKVKNITTRVDGSQSRVVSYAWDGAGRTTGVSESGRATHAQYDSAGRLQKSVSGAGDESAVNSAFEQNDITGHSGTLPESITRKEKTGTSYSLALQYNTLGNVTSNQFGGLTFEQQFDQAGNATSVKVPGHPETKYDYDSRGAMKSETLPGGLQNKYEYHASGARTTL